MAKTATTTGACKDANTLHGEASPGRRRGPWLGGDVVRGCVASPTESANITRRRQP